VIAWHLRRLGATPGRGYQLLDAAVFRSNQHSVSAKLRTSVRYPWRMATKAQRVEARLTALQRRQIEQAAALSGESVSGFMVLAALERAEAVVVEQATTVVPTAYFDRLVASLDEPEKAPRLARAVRAARRRRRITAA